MKFALIALAAVMAATTFASFALALGDKMTCFQESSRPACSACCEKEGYDPVRSIAYVAQTASEGRPATIRCWCAEFLKAT